MTNSLLQDIRARQVRTFIAGVISALHKRVKRRAALQPQHGSDDLVGRDTGLVRHTIMSDEL
jgi:hypothetical protein